MKIKIIRTEEEYEEALALVAGLMDAVPNSAEADDLEVLSILIEKYEQEHYPIDMPDPISAIKFRMDQEGLIQKDLIPYIGSQPKVSAVLNGKCELSKDMIRKLHDGLGIPYEVLMQKPNATLNVQRYFKENFPFNEMVRQGYFLGFYDLRTAKQRSEELLESLFSIFKENNPSPVYMKSTDRTINENSLLAWQAHVLHQIVDDEIPDFNPDNLGDTFFTDLLRFSTYEKGLQIVKEHLNKSGIHFVISKHLSQTYLDGASFWAHDNRPVVGITLRQDRLDNFWFTLFHELGHVKLHLDKSLQAAFFDDTEGNGDGSNDQLEIEANQFARSRMISDEIWEVKIKPQLGFLLEDDVIELGQLLRVNPAILAGRIRYEINDYSSYKDLVGYGKVREQFAEFKVAV